jgi:hypothetical protein
MKRTLVLAEGVESESNILSRAFARFRRAPPQIREWPRVFPGSAPSSPTRGIGVVSHRVAHQLR